MPTISNRKPHDEFFKQTFSNSRIAGAYIRTFLDAQLVKALNLQELTLEKTSYISKQLKPFFSDIVYSCPFRDTEVKLAFLFEHKSGVVPYPHVQLLRYILEVWENSVKKQKELQIVVPMLFYHGEEKWEYRPMTEYFGKVGEMFNKYVPLFDFEFLNISMWSDERIIALEEAFLINALLVFKHIWDEEYVQRNINRLFVLLDRVPDREERTNFIESIFVYLLRSSVFSEVNLLDMIDNVQESYREGAMSAYDRLVETGRVEGKAEGDLLRLKIAVENMRKEGFEVEQMARLLSVAEERIHEIIKLLDE